MRLILALAAGRGHGAVKRPIRFGRASSEGHGRGRWSAIGGLLGSKRLDRPAVAIEMRRSRGRHIGSPFRRGLRKEGIHRFACMAAVRVASGERLIATTGAALRRQASSRCESCIAIKKMTGCGKAGERYRVSGPAILAPRTVSGRAIMRGGQRAGRRETPTTSTFMLLVEVSAKAVLPICKGPRGKGCLFRASSAKGRALLNAAIQAMPGLA